MTKSDTPIIHFTEEVAFPEELINAHRQGDLVIFVGAGASMGEPASLPSFRSLAAKLAELACINPPNEDVTDYDRFLGSFPRDFDIRRHTLNLVSPAESRPNRTHEAIIRLASAYGSLRIVTTNYDNHLAAAAQENRVILPQRWDAPLLPQGDDFSGLVHLHGSTEGDPHGIVLTDEDFGNAYLSNGWATRFLVPMFNRYTVLFIGYSYSDLIMRYLGRALSARMRCFALVRSSDSNEDHWSSLGVHPIHYPGQDNDHSALANALEGWVNFAYMKEPDHRGRMGGILNKGVESLNRVDRDYMIARLNTLEGVQDFTAKTSGLDRKQKWEWLCWIGNNIKGFAEAFKGDESGDRVFRLLEWYSRTFVADESLSGSALEITQTHGDRFSDQLLSLVSRYVHCLDNTSRCKGKWKAFIVSSSRSRTPSHPPISYEPGQDAESLAILSSIVRPRLKLESTWPIPEDGIPNAPRADLTWDTYEVDLKAHLSKAVEQAPAGDPQLGIMLENALLECHQIIALYNGKDRGALFCRRHAIDDHILNGDSKELNALIDALRDYGIKSQQAGTDLSERWWNYEVEFFQRLSIYLVAKSDRSHDDKILWLLSHAKLNSKIYEREILSLLDGDLELASSGVKEQILEKLVEGAASTDRYCASIRNMFDFLTHTYPEWDAVAEARGQYLKKFPYFSSQVPQALEDKPAIKSDNDEGSLSIKDTLALVKDGSAYAAERLDKLFSESILTECRWGDFCDAVQSTCRSSPDAGLLLLDAIQDSGISADRIKEFRRRVVDGWAGADIAGFEDKIADELSVLADSFCEQDLNTIGSFLVSQVKSGSVTGQMREIASRIWAENSQSFTCPEGVKLAGIIPLWINSWPGYLAQYWVTEILNRRQEGRAFPLNAQETEVLNEIIGSPMDTGAAALPALTHQLGFLYRIDHEFTTQNILPLLSQPETAVYTWSSFLYQPDLAERMLESGLSEAFLSMWERPYSLKNEDQIKFMDFTLEAISSDEMNSGIRDKLLSQMVVNLNREDRRRIPERARLLLRRIADGKDEVAADLWDSWLRDHLIRRLDGIPREPTIDELIAWADTVPFLHENFSAAWEMFQDRDIPLNLESLNPLPSRETISALGKNLVAYYEKRVQAVSGRPEVLFNSRFLGLLKRLREVLGDDLVKPLEDVGNDVGLHSLS